MSSELQTNDSPATKRNIRLVIEYDGSEWHGWQRQVDKPTVQAQIEDTLSAVLDQKTVIFGASRTDTGVHARGQVANFFTTAPYDPARWSRMLNSKLPFSIRVQLSEEVPLSFNAQRFALAKTYEYRILNRHVASALDRRVYFYPKIIDWARIREAMPHFLGTQDFAAFQAAKATVKTTIRTLTRFDLEETERGLYVFQVEGNGFLKQMVRAMVGTLLEVGEGKREASDIPRVLASRDRREAGRTVPAHGLCLLKINYPH